MFKRLPFPWAYVLEPILALPLFASFYFVIAFLASQPADVVRATGAAIPLNWEAALPNHGGYLRGFSASAHPGLVALSVASLVVFGVIAWQLRLAQAAQRAAATPEHSRHHSIAAGATFASWAAIAFLLVTQVLPYLAAA